MKSPLPKITIPQDKNAKTAFEVEIWTVIIFYITLLSAVVLMIISIIYPPKGQIDASVLQGCIILLLFATIAQIPDFIKAGHSIKVNKGDTQIEIKKHEGE